MKGLLIKDAILIKKYCILNFAISVLFFAISVIDPENILFALVSVVLISLIPITINAYDEQFKWNLFEAALPLNRKTVVLEKYALLLILVLPVTVIYSLIGLIFNDFSLEEFLFNWSVMLFTGIITPCVTIPILLKFGYIKSRVISIVVIILFAAGGAGAANIVDLAEIPTNISGPVPLILILVSAVIAFISYLISNAIYAKKEF